MNSTQSSPPKLSRKKQLGMQAASRRHIIRGLLSRGEIEEAGMKCSEWGIDISECRLPADNEAVPELLQEASPELVQAMESKAPPPPPLPSPEIELPIASRWPVETDLVMSGQPVNRRMMLATLPDGRKAMMWKRGSNFPVFSKVRARLCDQVGPDAYYEPVVS